jgi:hypothetical protein
MSAASIIVRTSIGPGQLVIDIFPIDLSASGGWPRLAAKDKALATLSRLQRISQPYGTEIVMVNYGATAAGRIIIPTPSRHGDAK